MENKKKQLRGSKIDENILEYLTKLPLTATTEMVAKELRIAWYSAAMHLNKLKDEGKIRLYRIGRQNQWILSERVERMNK